MDHSRLQVHRHPHIRHQPGLYAFVVDDRIRYVGRTTRLHRRLRNYSNRCFAPTGARELRICHLGIVQTVAAGETVSVWVRPLSSGALDSEESRLIDEWAPPWNRPPAPVTAGGPGPPPPRAEI